MWSDNETVDDLIGFRVHADLIREVVMDKRLLPVTLGVFGDWGNGKTSIMRMLEQDLDPDSQEDPAEKIKCESVAVLYFNGWLFEGYDDAKSALLSSILKQLAEHKRFGPKVREKVSKLFKRVDWMRVSKAGLTAIALPAIAAYASTHPEFAPTSIPLVGRLLSWGSDREKEKGSEDKKPFLKEPSEEDELSDIRSFREEFGKLLKESHVETLVVLIDDLDRCSPERLIENLEAIKLFLNVENTAFVIGADPRIVRHAIAVRYRESINADKRRRRGSAYNRLPGKADPGSLSPSASFPVGNRNVHWHCFSACAIWRRKDLESVSTLATDSGPQIASEALVLRMFRQP